jgi:8-hydroxy-5-deazaflavin:NADPH oxidoreductase
MARSIAVLGGSGPEGFGLALRWARAGESVVIGSRDAKRAQEAAEKIGRQVPGTSISGEENSAACASADIIVLTIPFEGHATLLKQIKPAIRARSIVIDTTVPLAASVGGRATRTLGVWQGSAAQETAEFVPKGVPVVAAFHHISADLLNAEGPVDCDVVVCGDDAPANLTVRQLAARIPGVRAVDGGKLENARILEEITALLIGLNIRHKGHSGLRITGLPAAAYEGSK